MSDDTEKKRPPRAKGTGSIFRPKGSRFLWIGYTSGGMRHVESTKSEKKSDAQALLTSRLGDTGRGMVVTPKMFKITFGEGLKAVYSDLTMNGRKTADDTKARYDKHILLHPAEDGKPAGGFFAADRRMNTIATADIEAYKAHRLEQKAAPATVNRELAAIRRAFRLAVDGGKLAMMPKVRLLQEHNVRTGFFERHEFDAILAHLPEELHPPLKFAYATGWRFKSEVLPLTIERVDLRARVVRLDPGSTKSGQGRSFSMTNEVHAVLKTQIAALDALKKKGIISAYVFHRADGTVIKDFKKTWRNACETAGYPGKIFHDFRRTAVRNLERAGVPRSTAMQIVGHQTESIYRRYAIVDESMHREAAAQLDMFAAKEKAKAAAERKAQLRRFKKRQIA
jgi:integrase